MTKSQLSPPHIVCAAIRYGELIIVGARHHDVRMRQVIRALGGRSKLLESCHQEEQGFIDQHGVFYNRVAAMAVVKQNGQPFDIKRNGTRDTRLFSEGLY